MRILIAAVLCAVICFTSIGFSISSIKQKFVEISVSLAGGDRVVSNSAPISQDIIATAHKNNLLTTQTVSFYSMLVNKENLILAAVRAVENNYPLRGNLVISNQPDGQVINTKQIPEPGTIWLEPRILLVLDAKIGDTVTLGDAELQITKLLIAEPDRISAGLSFAPRALINQQDLAKTKSVQPGSRVNYKLLITGSDANLQKFDKLVKTDVINKDTTAFKNIQRAESYLMLAVLVNMVISAVVIAIAAQKYSTSRIKDIAIIRCMGASPKKILHIYTWNFLLLAGSLGIIGGIVGFGIQQIFALFINKYLLLQLPLPSFMPFLYGLFSAIFLIMAFGFPAMLQVSQISPLQVLRRISLSSQRFNNKLFGRVSDRLPAWLKLSLNNILYNAKTNLVQMFAFALIIGVALLLFLIRVDLLNTWQDQLPETTPNYFVINIAPDDIKLIKNFLNNNSIESTSFYPMVRGRLTKINQKQPLVDNINRPLNLTWTQELPADNKILQGEWFTAADQNQPVLSIEQTFADRLEVKLGDELSFLINNTEINARITSIRSVDWGSFRPNFYIIYPAGILEQFPNTAMASFYVPPEQEKVTLQLAREFPEINLLSVRSMLAQAKQVLNLLVFIIAYIWLFTMLISVLLLVIIVLTSMQMRNFQNNLMRILGASKRQLLKILCVEFIVIGFVSGLLGAITASLLAKYVAVSILQTSYSINWSMLALGCIAGSGIMLIGGLLSTYTLLKRSPIQLLRNLN